MLGYIIVIVVLVLLAVVYVAQRSTILRQGYDIARLRAEINDVSKSNMQIKSEVAAELRPMRIMAVLGDKSASYVRPVDKNFLDASSGAQIEGFVRK